MGDNADNDTRRLENYRSLTDPHLFNYFSKSRMRRHLRKAGLVHSSGAVLSESTYHLKISEKEEQERTKKLFLRAVADKKQELQREHTALIERTMEDISKLERVLRIKNSSKQRLFPVVGAGRLSSTSAAGRMRTFDDDADAPKRERDYPARHLKTQSPYSAKHIPTVLLPQNSQRHNKQSQERQHSPVRKKYSFRRERKPTLLRMRKTRTADGEKKGPHAGSALVTMRYYGTSVNLESERTDRRDEVVVMQQHCGGNTLCVFSKKVLPGEEFSFVSRRHAGFPFSTTIYVNGAADCRLSACCEYRHRMMTRIGSKGGHFGVEHVRGGVPCIRCRAKYGRKGSSGEKIDGSGSSSDSDSAYYDNMLYIPVDESDSEDEIDVRSAEKSKSDYSSSSASESEGSETEYIYDGERMIELPEEDMGGLKIAVPSSTTEKSEKSVASSNDDSYSDGGSSDESSQHEEA